MGILIIIGIFSSYIPLMAVDDCPEGDHMGNMKMDCRYCFHCPFLFSTDSLDPLPLPFTGELVLGPSLPKVDEMVHPIFHPPKDQATALIISVYSRG